MPLRGQGAGTGLLLSSLDVSPRSLGGCQLKGKALWWSEVTLWGRREFSMESALFQFISLLGTALRRPPPQHCVGFAREGELPDQQRLPLDLLPLQVPVTH